MKITVNCRFSRDNCEPCDYCDWRRERLISFGAYLHRMRVTTHSLKENHMKRLPQTLTAAALTGALAFGGAAVAQAEDATPADQSAPSADAVDTADATTGTAEVAPRTLQMKLQMPQPPMPTRPMAPRTPLLRTPLPTSQLSALTLSNLMARLGTSTSTASTTLTALIWQRGWARIWRATD